MKAEVAQILWHNKQPIYSVDTHSSGRLATCGADNEIKIWKINRSVEGRPEMEYQASLARHEKTVNVVRFAPQGTVLASGSDDGCIFLWRLSDNFVKSEENDEKEAWIATQCLRGHPRDIYDISWAPLGNAMISGSIDNSAIVWDTLKGRERQQFRDHHHYVQGVAWDPLGQYLVTQSSDRSIRIYTRANKSQESHSRFYCAHHVRKHDARKEDKLTTVESVGDLPELQKQPSGPRLFFDESVPTFFRRPSWSPDGTILVVPAGQKVLSGTQAIVPTTYIFHRRDLSRPLAQLPCPKQIMIGTDPKPSIVVKFSPVIYQNRDAENVPPNGYLSLPYRMIFAVATLDTILFYDTQLPHAFSIVGNLHCTAITDIAWSKDGLGVIVSSSDGFCSVIDFNQEELGTPIPYEELPLSVQKATQPQNFVVPRKTPTAKVDGSDKESSNPNPGPQSNLPLPALVLSTHPPSDMDIVDNTQTQPATNVQPTLVSQEHTESIITHPPNNPVEGNHERDSAEKADAVNTPNQSQPPAPDEQHKKKRKVDLIFISALPNRATPAPPS